MADEMVHESIEVLIPFVGKYPAQINRAKPPASLNAKTTAAERLLHDARAQGAHQESHKDTGEYLKAMVFGGLDGILTSFAIVAGSAGGRLSVSVVLVLGFSNIFADALSMGVGEYLSSKAHNEYVMAEKKREEWELKNHREGEILEMVEIFEAYCGFGIYTPDVNFRVACVDHMELTVAWGCIPLMVALGAVQKRGMSRADAEDVIRTMARYDDFFVNIMMKEELGLQVPAEEGDDTIKEGFVMFLSFAFFGAMPLLGYVVVPWIAPSSSSELLFSVACVVTGVTLFTMGAVKSQFGTRGWFVSGTEMLILGGVCAAVAYEIGMRVDSIVPDTSRR